MKFIINNPYRIIGVLANVTEKELLKQKNKFLAYSKANKEIKSELDFTGFPEIKRDANTISKAFSQIELQEDRLFYSLFWFVNELPIDNIAIEHMKMGDLDKAYDVWSKAVLDRDVTERNISAFNNFSTLLFIRGNDKQALLYKTNMIESPFFNGFVSRLVNDKFTMSSQKFSERFFRDYFSISGEIKEKYITKYLLSVLSNDSQVKKLLLQKSSQEKIIEIERLLDRMEELQNIDHHQSFFLETRKYINNFSDKIGELKRLLGSNDLQVAMLQDNFAEKLRQSVNVFFNRGDGDSLTKEDVENCRVFMAVAKEYATKNGRTIHIIEEELENYEEEVRGFEIKKSMVSIVHLAEKIKEFNSRNQSIDSALLFVKDCHDYLSNIKQRLGKDNELYLKMSSAIVNNCLNISIDEVNNAQSRVNKGISFQVLKGKIINSMSLLSYLRNFDMDGETKKRLNVNYDSIVKLNHDITQILSRASNSSSANNSSSSSSDNEGCASIMGWIITVLIVLAIVGAFK